jgi:hypothetical protein
MVVREAGAQGSDGEGSADGRRAAATRAVLHGRRAATARGMLQCMVSILRHQMFIYFFFFFRNLQMFVYIAWIYQI